jgi:PAS domain S-box-containing protein
MRLPSSPRFTRGTSSRGILALFEDITQRKRAENALRDSEVRFRGVFEGSQLGMAIVDTNMRIIHANPALGELFGCLRRTLAGVMAEELIHPDDEAGYCVACEQAFAGQDKLFYSGEPVCEDGRHESL